MTIDQARLVRASRAAALDWAANGGLTLADALRNPPKRLHGVQLHQLLTRYPGIGRETCRTICERARVWPLLTLGEMTPAERRAVINQLPPRAQ